MEEDSSENPLASLQYHTLMVLGTEDYAVGRAFQISQLLPEGAGADGQQVLGMGSKEEDQQRSKDAIRNTSNHNDREPSTSGSSNNVFDALRKRERPYGREPSEGGAAATQNGIPPSNFVVSSNQSVNIVSKSSGPPPNSPPVSLEYCSSPVPRFTYPSYDHVRPAAPSSVCPLGGAASRGPTAQAAHLTYRSAGVIFPPLTPQSSLSSGSHLEFSSPASWSSAGSFRTPCVSSISSTESVRPCRRDLVPHCLYSHDKVPSPIPVAAASLGLHPARLRRACLAECASSCSEKTLVGSKPDSARIFGSDWNSESLSPDIADSNPVYENPSELDSEYYYKSPKGKTQQRLQVGWLPAFFVSSRRYAVTKKENMIFKCIKL